MSGIVRAVHQSSSKLGDTPLARLDLFESLPSRRFGCRASTTNSTTKSRSTSLYNAGASSRGGCRALQLYSALQRSRALYISTALQRSTLYILYTLPQEENQPRPRRVQLKSPRGSPCGKAPAEIPAKHRRSFPSSNSAQSRPARAPARPPKFPSRCTPPEHPPTSPPQAGAAVEVETCASRPPRLNGRFRRVDR